MAKRSVCSLVSGTTSATHAAPPAEAGEVAGLRRERRQRKWDEKALEGWVEI